MGVRIPPPLPVWRLTSGRSNREGRNVAEPVPGSDEVFMATQAVKVKHEESQGGGPGELGKKLTGTVQDTREFLHDVRVEMKQVTWPSRDDVVSTTGVVIATVAFFGIFLTIVERLAQWGLYRLLSYFHV